MPTVSDKTLLSVLLALLAISVVFFTTVDRYQASGPDLLAASSWRTLDGRSAQTLASGGGLLHSTLTVHADTPGRFVGVQQSLPAPPAGERLRLSARLRVSDLRGRLPGTFPARLLFIPRGVGSRPLWRLPHVVAQFDANTPTPALASKSRPWLEVARTFAVADGVQSLTIRADLRWSAGRIELQRVRLQPVRLAVAYRTGRAALAVVWAVLAALLLVRAAQQNLWRIAHLPAAAAALLLLAGALAPNPAPPVSAALPVLPVVLPVAPAAQSLRESWIWVALRKSAHFIGFAVLTGLLLLSALGRTNPLRVLAAVALFAAVTEVLQFFSPTRSPQLTDLMIDGAGAAAAVLLMFAVRWANAKRVGGRRFR